MIKLAFQVRFGKMLNITARITLKKYPSIKTGFNINRKISEIKNQFLTSTGKYLLAL